ncbi:MAG: anti-sigma factor [Candidatus Limnocylindria bacterium]
MNCRDVDELAAAYGLGAVEPDEERHIGEHLASCRLPHEEARSLVATASALGMVVEPITPSPALRPRLMATIAMIPQEPPFPVAAEPTEVPALATTPPRRRPWWQSVPLTAAGAAVMLAVAIGLGAWNLNLAQQLADREVALRAIAAADAAYPVTGSAGSGWLLETDGQALFLAGNLAELPADRIYEMWLIGADGVPVAVGVVENPEGLTSVTLERGFGSAQTFAVTVETQRVEVPTSDPVLVAPLDT